MNAFEEFMEEFNNLELPTLKTDIKIENDSENILNNFSKMENETAGHVEEH